MVINLRCTDAKYSTVKLSEEENQKQLKLKESITKLVNETNEIPQSSYHEIIDNNNNVSLNVQKHLAN